MVAGDSINGFRNTNSGKDGTGQPPWQNYRDLVRALRDLQMDGLLTTSVDSGGAEGADNLVFMPSAAAINSPSYLKVCAMLGIAGDGAGLAQGPGAGP